MSVLDPNLRTRVEGALKRIAIVGVFCIVAVGPPAAGFAECCRVVKTDELTPSSNIRVCEVGPLRHCGELLFAGDLALGEDEPVCSEGRTIVYQEFNFTVGAFGPPTEALCLDGLDVEL